MCACVCIIQVCVRVCMCACSKHVHTYTYAYNFILHAFSMFSESSNLSNSRRWINTSTSGRIEVTAALEVRGRKGTTASASIGCG